MRLLLAASLLAACAGPALAAGRAMTIDDLLGVKSVSDPQVSPDGKLVVYVMSELDRATEKSNADLYLVPIGGGEPRRLTTSAGADNHPRWSPDGKSIAFNSTRSGSTQVWLLPIEGGEARPLTKLPIDAAGPIWSPTGEHVAFAGKVFPGKTPEETASLDEKKGKEKSKVQVYDKLMVRHWDEWDDGKRSHLFVVEVATGMVKDLTPKLAVNAPPAPFGGSSDYAFSPNGMELAFTAEPSKDMAWSTNTDIWIVSINGNEPANVTEGSPGADAQPSYSPDGDYLAYVSQARPGFEADRWALMVRDRSSGEVTDLTAKVDRPVQSFAWGGSRDVKKPFEGKVRDLFAAFDDGGSIAIRGLGILADGDGHVFVREHDGRIGGGGEHLAPGGARRTRGRLRPRLGQHAERGLPGPVGRVAHDPADPPQRPSRGPARPAPRREVLLPGRRRRRGRGLAGQAAGVRPEGEIPGRLPDPRRPSRGLARRVA